MSNDYGVFPFGQANTVRPMRPASNGLAKLLVVGVYPSAFHVGWQAPVHLGGGRVRSMAVDVEPEVFWTGDADDEAAARRIEDWKSAVGFQVGDGPGQHGKVWRGTNGGTGRTLKERYLDCLGVAPAETAFTDVYQAFLLKRGGGKDRLGGDAIDQDYAPAAEQDGWPEVTIATRPDEDTLVDWACERFGDRLRAHLSTAKPTDTVISLGDEALRVLLRLLGPDAQSPGATLPEIYDGGAYGEPGTLRIEGREVEWFPLVHPGLLKGREAPPGPRGRFHRAHDRWCKQMHAGSTGTAP